MAKTINYYDKDDDDIKEAIREVLTQKNKSSDEKFDLLRRLLIDNAPVDEKFYIRALEILRVNIFSRDKYAKTIDEHNQKRIYRTLIAYHISKLLINKVDITNVLKEYIKQANRYKLTEIDINGWILTAAKGVVLTYLTGRMAKRVAMRVPTQTKFIDNPNRGIPVVQGVLRDHDTQSTDVLFLKCLSGEMSSEPNSNLDNDYVRNVLTVIGDVKDNINTKLDSIFIRTELSKLEKRIQNLEKINSESPSVFSIFLQMVPLAALGFAGSAIGALLASSMVKRMGKSSAYQSLLNKVTNRRIMPSPQNARRSQKRVINKKRESFRKSIDEAIKNMSNEGWQTFFNTFYDSIIKDHNNPGSWKAKWVGDDSLSSFLDNIKQSNDLSLDILRCSIRLKKYDDSKLKEIFDVLEVLKYRWSKDTTAALTVKQGGPAVIGDNTEKFNVVYNINNYLQEEYENLLFISMLKTNAPLLTFDFSKDIVSWNPYFALLVVHIGRISDKDLGSNYLQNSKDLINSLVLVFRLGSIDYGASISLLYFIEIVERRDSSPFLKWLVSELELARSNNNTSIAVLSFGIGQIYNPNDHEDHPYDEEKVVALKLSFTGSGPFIGYNRYWYVSHVYPMVNTIIVDAILQPRDVINVRQDLAQESEHVYKINNVKYQEASFNKNFYFPLIE